MIITNRTTHNVQQGTPAWLELRTGYPTASEAPAAQGVSRYMTRSELLRQKATGITPEHDDRTLARFAEGHRVEELARPLAEAYLGEELSNVTMTAVADGLPLLASLDGINFDGDISWECKLWTESLAEQVRTNNLSAQYTVQMDQQQLVSGAVRTLFTCTDGTPERTVHCWYQSTDEKKAAVVMHWRQFLQDVDEYVPQPPNTEPLHEAKLREALPALRIDARGEITFSNLNEFKTVALERINNVNTRLETDQHFFDADADAKWLRNVSIAMKQAGKQVRISMQSVDEVLNVLEQLDQIATKKAIALEKLIKSEKDLRKQAIVTGAQAQLDQHIAALNQRLGANWLPRVAGGFGEVIKGKKSLANMEDAVAVALTNAKHDMNVLAERLEANRKHLIQEDGDWIALFADFATAGAKDEEFFQALAAMRISQHKQAEAARLEAERERIRAEEAAKLHAQAAIEAAAKTEAPSAQPDPVAEAKAPETVTQQVQAAHVNEPAHDGDTLTLGQINALIAPLKVDAAGLEQLGFMPSKTVKAAKHYAAHKLPSMVQAMVTHLQGVLATA